MLTADWRGSVLYLMNAQRGERRDWREITEPEYHTNYYSTVFLLRRANSFKPYLYIVCCYINIPDLIRKLLLLFLSRSLLSHMCNFQ